MWGKHQMINYEAAPNGFITPERVSRRFKVFFIETWGWARNMSGWLEKNGDESAEEMWEVKGQRVRIKWVSEEFKAKALFCLIKSIAEQPPSILFDFLRVTLYFIVTPSCPFFCHTFAPSALIRLLFSSFLKRYIWDEFQRPPPPQVNIHAFTS